MLRLCFASNNQHKIAEVQAIVGPSFKLLSLHEIGCFEELPEEQPTIAGNSLQKAEWVHAHYNIATIADDSGLEVLSLNGEPGVDSAHYAGPQRSHDDNISLLLKNLNGIADRRASFCTIITFIAQSHQIHQFEGRLPGTILDDKRGAGGFGYDPIFLPDGFDRTLAEMTMAEKNAISHRGKAIEKLMVFLKSQNAV